MNLHKSLPLLLAAAFALMLVPATNASPETDSMCVEDVSGNLLIILYVCVGEFAAIAVTAGWTHTCVLLSTGNVDCYGQNYSGQAADYAGGNAIAVTAGDDHTCVLLSTGNVDCYGDNGFGQAADYTRIL